MKRLTPREFAAEIGKSLNFAMALINAGEIVVEDVRSPGSTLPRYEIPADQVSAWRQSRRKRVLPEPVKQKRHRSEATEIIH